MEQQIKMAKPNKNGKISISKLTPKKRTKLHNFIYFLKLKFESMKTFWHILITNDQKMKIEMQEFQKFLIDKQRTERMLQELSEEERKMYYSVERTINANDDIKRGIFKAARIVKREEDAKKDLKLLREKESLVKAITAVLNEYVDKKVDLALKIHQKNATLSHHKNLQIKSVLAEAFKIEEY